MHRFLPGLLFVVSITQARSVEADGLIFQLPADGAWAKYDVKTEGKQRIGDFEMPVDAAGTLTIRSVGKVLRNGQACRWIELQSECVEEGYYPRLILKMLIPEKRLVRGEDPLAHSVSTFFDPKPMDEATAPKFESFIDEGFNRIQYEIDRFRLDFPKPLTYGRACARETVETPAGRFEDCEIIEGTSDYDGPLVKGGRSVFSGKYRIAVHPRSPFGVVAVTIESSGREFGDDNEESVQLKVKRTLTLAASGNDAATALPKRPPE